MDLQNKQIDESIARDGEFRLPIDHRPQQSLRTDGIEIATMDTPIPESNKGYRLLAKMGWSAGKGLGRNESGIVDPIRGSETSGLRWLRAPDAVPAACLAALLPAATSSDHPTPSLSSPIWTCPVAVVSSE